MGKKHQDPSQEKQSQGEARPGGRRVYLFGRLENEVTLPVIRKLQRLNDKDPGKPIDLYINSSGGNGYNADAIIATIHSLEARVNTICLGHALSGACEILASGTGHRAAYEFATLMFHQTLWEADGDITNLEIQAAQGQRFRNAQIEMLTRCTGQKKDIIRKDIERDFYLSAKEAVGYGLIDKVIEHKGKRQAPPARPANIQPALATGKPPLPPGKPASKVAQGSRSTRKAGPRRRQNG